MKLKLIHLVLSINFLEIINSLEVSSTVSFIENENKTQVQNISKIVQNSLLKISKKVKKRKKNINYLTETPETFISNTSETTKLNFEKKLKNKKKKSTKKLKKEKNSNTEINYSINRKNNRCAKNNGGCSQICYLKGRKKCACHLGYKLAKNKKSCIDINECLVNSGNCSQQCENIPGSYLCSCFEGFRLDSDLKSCQDINECFLRNGHGPCQKICKNTYGSYVCGCPNNEQLERDGHSCQDEDECAKGISGCSQMCINTLGKAFCSCREGFELGPDWKTCIDINECEDTEIRRTCNECVNEIGSYYCETKIQSDEPYKQKDQINCPPLIKPHHGHIRCQQEAELHNHPGTVCRLVCPKGSKLEGHFYVTCGMFGKWLGFKKGFCFKNH